MPKKIYIVDGHSHIYAAYYAPMRPLTSPSGEPTKAAYIFTTTILGLVKNVKPDMLVVTMDSKTPSFRTKIYPDYKAHRPPMPDDMPVQIDRIEQILKAMGIVVLRLDGFEADDIIGTIAKKAAENNIDAYICSKDKDMLQLLNEHVFTYNIKTATRTDSEAMTARLGIRPEQFIDYLALQGDTADNVPGVPDVGPKTALEWIQKYGSLENLYQHADQIKGKRGQSLTDSRELAFLSRQLVTINCDAPVEIDFQAFAMKEPNRKKLADIFTELGFVRLMAQLNMTETEAAELDAHAVQLSSAKTVKHNYRLVDTPEKFDSFLTELQKQKLFAVDTETTSINPMRAELVGMSFSWQANTAFYLPIKAPLGSKHLDRENVRQKLAPILSDKTVRKIGQNIKYDMLVLQSAKMPLNGIYFDTMVASYCLDPQRNSNSLDNMAADFLNYHCIPISSLIGKGKSQLTFDMVDTITASEYAAEDADVTFQLYLYLAKEFEKQHEIKKLFEDVEMPLVPVLAAMEYNGVSLDTGLLRKMSGQLTEAAEKLSEQIYDSAGVVFNIDSPKQLGSILFDRLGLRIIRIGKTVRSTSAAVLEQLTSEHPIIDLVLRYRTITKLQNTYVDKLGALINPRTNRVHASFNQTITATGRLSSSAPNLQNIPIRTELGRKIRSAFVPENKKGCILSADYSQIELRLLAHLSKDKALLDAFRADQDIHSFVASQIYGIPIDEVTGKMRSKCKAVNFGIIYGQGAFGLSKSIGITQTEAKKFIEDYFARYSSIRQFTKDVIDLAGQTGYAETILGRRRKIANLKNKNANKRAQAERLAINTVIQGSAADLIKVAMINIQRKIETENLPVKMILQIHDELVFELPKADAQSCEQWIAAEMSDAIKLDVPLKVDISTGPSWLEEK